MQYLQQDGAAIHFTREPDRSRGNHPLSGRPWWQMCAPFYLYDKGYPQWVYSAITNSIPGDPNYTTTQVDDDRRSRPEASNYDSTDLYLAIHTNAFQGSCYGTSCPTGIEMYADAAQLGGFFNQSLSLATKSQTAIYAAVRATYSSSYPCRNNCVPRTNQQFTEIHYPRRPACLLELGFHDSCDTDVIAQKDPVYTSSAMWGYYKGVCDFFGVTPTWDVRSYEVVSSNIPTIVKGGSTFDLHITLRNRGCAWTEQRQFRLGAVNNSDPFTKTIRYSVPDTIGPGETVTFTIPMTTPVTDLALYTDWRMVQDERNAWFGPGIFGVVQVDSSPPTSPGPVDDGGPAQFSTTSLTASWRESTDAKTGIARYEYRVTEKDGPEVLGWQSAGLQTSITIPVPLSVGKTYQVWVKAVDSFGWETEPVSSPGVTVAAQLPIRIGEARAMPDGSPVLFESKVISAKFADCFYIQEDDRSAGIRVEGSVTADPGETVTVSGTMSTFDGDRSILQPQVSAALAAPGIPTPVALAGHALGGGYLGPHAPGVANGFGLGNLGLLVRVYGLVTASGAAGFRVHDGSLPDDGSGVQGVWIDTGAFHKPADGAFAIVTGVSSVQPGTNLRQVRVARDSDISP